MYLRMFKMKDKPANNDLRQQQQKNLERLKLISTIQKQDTKQQKKNNNFLRIVI